MTRMYWQKSWFKENQTSTLRIYGPMRKSGRGENVQQGMMFCRREKSNIEVVDRSKRKQRKHGRKRDYKAERR